MERIYISGPVDKPDLFLKSVNDLYNMDLKPISSLGLREIFSKKNPYKKISSEEFMQFQLENLLKCDGILMLQGWQDSKEAVIEHYVAKAVGKPFVKIKIF